MHGLEKSDSSIVPRKPANRAGRPAAGPLGMRGCKARFGHRAGSPCHKRRPTYEKRYQEQKEKLTALPHHITVNPLRAAFFALKRRAAPGIDAVTWDMYKEGREEIFTIFIGASMPERIGRCPRAGGTYQRRMAGNGRSDL